MKFVRWGAAGATLLMSLMNLPFAVDAGSLRVAPVLAWAISLLGVLGIVAAIGLLRHATWARPAVIVIGVVNLAAAVAAVISGIEGGFIGLVVSSLIVALGLLTHGGTEPRHHAATSPPQPQSSSTTAGKAS